MEEKTYRRIIFAMSRNEMTNPSLTWLEHFEPMVNIHKELLGSHLSVCLKLSKILNKF